MHRAPIRGRHAARFAAVAALGAVAACSNLSPTSRASLDLFDTYWQALADGYPFFASKHIDWQALGAQYRAAVVHAEQPAERYHLIAGMLSELRDPHVSLEVPEANWAPGGGRVSLTDAPGLELAMPEGHLHVLRWPDGAAPVPPDHLRGAAAAFPEIVEVEGYPVAWPIVNGLLAGAPGSEAELRLRWSDGTLSRHVLRRPKQPKRVRVVWEGKSIEVTLGAAQRTPDSATGLARRGRWAVLHIDTFDAEDLGVEPAALVVRLDQHLEAAGAADGLILDLRKNGGGDGDVAWPFAGRFLREPMRSVLATEQTTYLFGLISFTAYGSLSWEPRPPRFTKPIVVLTSWRTASAAEHVTRMLQRHCGAIVVGERTIGAEAMVETVAGPDGSRLRYGRLRAMETSGRGLQGDGVIPDLAVRLTLDDVRRLGSERAADEEWTERLMRRAEAALARLAVADAGDGAR